MNVAGIKLIRTKTFLSKAEYITKISSYDRQKLDEYAATKEKIAEKEKSLVE